MKSLICEKTEQAKSILREFGIDCWITFVRESSINGDPTLAYLISSNVTWHSAFVITRSGDAQAFVGKYDQKSVEDTGAYNNVTGHVEGIKKPLLDYLKKINPEKVALNYSIGSEICDGLTHGMYLTMTEYLSEISFDKRIVSAENIVSALRERKSEIEIANIKEAIQTTEEIFKKVTGFIKPGKTEKEIAAFMKKEVAEKGLSVAWEEHVCPSVYTGPDTAVAHYAPTDRIVERGHILNMDFGVKINDYCSDLQRTFYILDKGEEKAPEDVQKGFNVIVEAVEKSKQAMKPGVKGLEVDSVARNIIVNNGYEEFPHALGHQVGRFAHDGTAMLAPKWEKYKNKPFVSLEKNMVFTIEPRLTVLGKGVATIEEMVIVTEKGAEWLSTPQKELILIR